MKKSVQAKPLTVDIKKYGGKQIAIYKGKIVAVGETTRETLNKAALKYPNVSRVEFRIFGVPKTVYSITA